MVEGKCIHIGNLIPKTALLSQKEALRESNFKRYGRRRMYTHRKFDSHKAAFWLERAVLGIKFYNCVYILLLPYLLKFDSRKAAFWLERAVLGIKFYKCIIVYTFCFYHTSWNLIPVKLLFGSKGPFWESQFLCVYICLLPYLLRFDSRKAAFWLERAVLGIKFPMCIHSPSTYLVKFDPRKASFWLKKAVLGIKFPL